ncbi:hypothetical protein D3C80_1486480 [compost metagenome]
MTQGNFLGDAQEGNGLPQQLLRMDQCLITQLGMGFHDLELGGLETARLEQNMISDPDLSDVVQRR